MSLINKKQLPAFSAALFAEVDLAVNNAKMFAEKRARKNSNLDGHVVALAAPAKLTPAQSYAHYRSLKGDARLAFYCKNAAAVWEGFDAEQNATR